LFFGPNVWTLVPVESSPWNLQRLASVLFTHCAAKLCGRCN